MKMHVKRIVLAALALVAIGALVGCSAITSEADAKKMAQVMGASSVTAQDNGGVAAKTAMAIRSANAADSKAINVDFTYDDPQGGSIRFETVADSVMPETEETATGYATYAKLTYKDLVATDDAGVEYTLNGVVYARLGLSIAPVGINFILTSSNMYVDSAEMSGSCDFDYTVELTLTGYSCHGQVGGYTVDTSFNIAG